MSGIFIKPDDTIKFDIYVGIENGEVIASGDKKEVLKSVKDDDIGSYSFEFRKPTYRDNIDVSSKAIKANGESVEWDPALLRYERFINLIKSWSLVDEDDKPLKPNVDNIDKLDPTFANAIVDKLDEILA